MQVALLYNGSHSQGSAAYPSSCVNLIPVENGKLPENQQYLTVVSQAFSYKDFGEIVVLSGMVDPKRKSKMVNTLDSRVSNSESANRSPLERSTINHRNLLNDLPKGLAIQIMSQAVLIADRVIFAPKKAAVYLVLMVATGSRPSIGQSLYVTHLDAFRQLLHDSTKFIE